MSQSDRTADDLIADWLPPSQAVEILEAVFGEGHVCRETLLECLRGARVRAVSANSTFHPEHSGTTGEAFHKIPAKDWELVNWNDSFWKTGILRYRRRKVGRTEFETVRHFNVRFDPDAVKAIVAPRVASLPNSATPNQAEGKPEADVDADYRKLPPVSEAHLESWFKLYSQVYGGSPLDTLPNAVWSARGMFPGRFVSRERVRDLAGGRTKGRKPRHGGG
jgi:hypothetical protein